MTRPRTLSTLSRVVAFTLLLALAGTSGATHGRTTRTTHRGAARTAMHGRTARAAHGHCTGTLHRRTTAMLHHGRVDSPRSRDEFLFAQLAVVVFVEGIEHTAGIGHPRRTARHRTRRSPALRPAGPIAMTALRTVVMSPRFRPTSMMAAVMVRSFGSPINISTAFRSVRTIGQ